jgi:hypothetical protein
MIPKVEWDGTVLPENGRQNWIEASARPAPAMQCFISQLINILLSHLSGSDSLR